MADHLAYWKTFWEYGPTEAQIHVCGTGYGSDQQDILERLASGDHIWIAGRSRDDQEWRLLQCIEVVEVVSDAEGTQRVIANPATSMFFDPDSQDDFEQFLTRLQFEPFKPVTTVGRVIGQSIQRIRRLCEADVAMLETYAGSLTNLAVGSQRT